MKILVAGATGALGHALIPKLARAGHDVVGLSRTEQSRRTVELLGATHAVGDLLAGEALHGVVAGIRPDVVIHAAKAIPKRAPIFFRDMVMTNRLHDEGTSNLVDAAIAAGASKLVVESIVFAYGYGDFGDRPITEDHPTRAKLPRRKLAEEVDAVLAMERHATRAADRGELASVVLRCGVFYGPLAGTDVIVRMLRRRSMALPGGGRAKWPVVYIDDVADAFLAAAVGDSTGVFNIVDDEPVPVREFVQEIARVANAPRPMPLPRIFGKLFVPYFTEVATTSMLISNDRAKDVLGWRPAHPTFREGLAAWAAHADIERPQSQQPA